MPRQMRSTSDLSLVTLVAEDTRMSTDARMAAIARIAHEWARATAGTVTGAHAERDADAWRARPGMSYIPRKR